MLAQMGTQARLMSQGMRKIVSLCHKSKTTVIFLNQVRHKVRPPGKPINTPARLSQLATVGRVTRCVGGSGDWGAEPSQRSLRPGSRGRNNQATCCACS